MGKQNIQLKLRPLQKYFNRSLQMFWYVPSDVLQRGIEASIWDACTFVTPSLDIGVGNGQMTQLLFQKHGVFSVGIDLEPSGLDEARATGLYKKVLAGDAQKMSFPDNSFKTVVSNSTFEHIANDKKAIKEVSRVLKVNGLFYFTVPSNFFPIEVLSIESGKGETIAKAQLKKLNDRLGHLHYRSLEEWKKLFSENHMEIVYHRHYMTPESFKSWYKLVTFITKKYKNREIWSYLAHSKLSRFIPVGFVKNLLSTVVLKKAFASAIATPTGTGAQLFMIVKKVR